MDNPFATEEIPALAEDGRDKEESDPQVDDWDPQVAAAAQALALATGVTRAEATAMILARKRAAAERDA